MSLPPPTRERPTDTQQESPPANELTLLLWVIAILIGALELTWWLFDRMYSP